MKSLSCALGALLLLASHGGAVAQAYPNRPITIVVPYAAGGPTDVLARLFARSMSDTLGQQVVVENTPGAAGTIGTVRVAKSRPDGYTLLASQNSAVAPVAAYYKQPPFDPVKDLEPVARVADVPFIYMTRKNAPVNNMREFVAWVKANDSKLNFGTGGVGTVSLGLVVLNSVLGVNVTGVPYKGTNLALNDMIAGTLDLMADQPTSSIQHIQNGSVKAIAITAAKRSAALPDLPTVIELGYPAMEINIWNGMWAPAGTPPAVINRLYEAVSTGFRNDAVRKTMAALGAELPIGDSSRPENFKAFVQSEVNRWVPLMRAAGVQPQ